MTIEEIMKFLDHLKAVGIGLCFFGAIATFFGLVFLCGTYPWIGVPILVLGLCWLVGITSPEMR